MQYANDRDRHLGHNISAVFLHTLVQIVVTIDLFHFFRLPVNLVSNVNMFKGQIWAFLKMGFVNHCQLTG